MQASEEIARAQRAKALMEDPLLVEAREAIEKSYLTSWRQAKTLDEQGVWHARVTALDDVYAYLSKVTADGKFAERKLQAEESRKPTRRT